MSVRRLAEKQPESFEFTPENKTWLEKRDRQISRWPTGFGRRPRAVAGAKAERLLAAAPAIEKVAETLGMPDIRVLEIATFYTMFNLEPVGQILRAALRHDALHAARFRRHHQSP